ncbi:MAG: hypothetical protein ACT4O9_08240 [Blastocatellia bacterium]
MRHTLLSVFLLLFSITYFAQQPNQSSPWAVTVQQNTTASSSIAFVNQCRGSHNFQIQGQNVPFLNIIRNQVQVNGGQTVNVPVQFNTHNLSVGVHQGQVLVACLTCRNEPTCMQDRDVLRVVLTVSPPANPTGNPPGQSPQPVNRSGPVDRPPRLLPNVAEDLNKFLKGPCPEKEKDCEKLRQKAAAFEQAAAEAQAKADAASKAASEAEARAATAEKAVRDAERAAQPAPQGGTITSGGETFSEADNAWLEAKRKKLMDDWKAGKISAEEQQRLRQELSGTDALKKAREERLAHEAKLKKEAEAAKAAAEKTRAEADKAKREADAARKAADYAKAAADAALEAYKKCLKEIEDECARAADEKKKKDAASASAAAKKGDEERRKREADARAKALQDELDYLLDNFKRLGLITHLPNANVPDPLDPAFDALQKITGESIRNFLQQVAGQVGGGPIDPTYISALGEAYKAMSALFNMRTKAGLERVHRLLTTKIINPKTGKIYTEDQAWNKIKRMEDLMNKIKAGLGK